MKVIRDVINRATGRITTRRIRRSRRSKVGGSMYKSKGKGFALKNNTNEVIYNTY